MRFNRAGEKFEVRLEGGAEVTQTITVSKFLR